MQLSNFATPPPVFASDIDEKNQSTISSFILVSLFSLNKKCGSEEIKCTQNRMKLRTWEHTYANKPRGLGLGVGR